jgi:hypothetical protein
MFARAHLILLCITFAALPALSQVEPAAAGGGAPPEDDTRMMTPPPVSGIPYANEAAADTRSNYLSGSLSGNAGYDDNVLLHASSAPVNAQTPVSDESYWIYPALTLNKSTARQTLSLGYAPSFTFYQHTSALNAVNHSASLVFQDRLSPHVSLSVEDYFLRTNDVFSGAYPFSSGNLTGTTQAPVPALIVPYLGQMSDTATGSVEYQFGRDSMVGGGASYSTFSFLNSAAAVGLSNSDGEGGLAFYTRRFSSKQYAGVSYNYSRDIVTDPPYGPFNVQLHTLLPFYSIYFTRKISLSISGGIQHVDISQLGVTSTYSQWSPVGTASVAWQGTRGNFALNYLHSIDSGAGLAEPLISDSVGASSGWKFSPTWSYSFEVSYVDSSPVTTRLGQTYSYQGGNALTLGTRLTHSMGEHFSAGCGFDRLQENYPGIPNASPDSDREYGTVSYLFKKAIGR